MKINSISTIKSIYSSHKKAVQVLKDISPHMLTVSIADTIVGAIIPYISIYLSGEIVTEISKGTSNKFGISVLVLTVICSTFLLSILKNVLSNKRAVLESNFYTEFELHINEISNNAPFEVLEQESFAILKEKVRRGNDEDVYGIPLVTTMICDAIRSLLTLGITIMLFANTMFHIKTISTISSFHVYILFLIYIVAVCIIGYLNGKASRTHNQVESSTSNLLAKLRNYRMYLFHNYMVDDRGAVEVRMRDLSKFIISEMDSNYTVPMLDTQKQLNANDRKYEFIVGVLSCLLTGICYLVVGICALLGVLRIGDVVVCYTSLNQLMLCLTSMSTLAARLDMNSKYICLYFELKTLCEMVDDGEKSINELDLSNLTIKFNNVSFSYKNSDRNALYNINAVFKAHQRTAIVGLNGAGKTTLIKLLCRLYTPSKGNITINNIDIREFKLNEYFCLLSVVFQDFCLFDFEIGENIAISSKYDIDKVINALKISDIQNNNRYHKEWINRCIGTNFSQNGISLSGGEKQKIAIARAIYKDSPIMILDEPTAALDPISESKIYESFDIITKNKTSIFISHRLSSCVFCDNILVFDDGRLVQNGNHSDLLYQTKGLYADLWKSQSTYYK